MTTGFLISLDPKDMARKFAHDPTDEIIAALDGDSSEDRDVPPLTLAEVERYLDRLPPYEADLIEMSLAGKRQVDIADVMGVTQAGISYRLRRACERIRFFSQLPDLTPEEIREALTPIMRPLHVEIMLAMWATSCQSESAGIVGVTQGRVRHAFITCVAQLEDLADFDPKYRVYAKGFRLVLENPNIYHEVEMSHWVSRRKPLEMIDARDWPTRAPRIR